MTQDLILTNYGPNKDVRVSHRTLAEYMGLRQDVVRDTIEKYIAQFEKISQCPFETENAAVGFGERQTKVFYLDADQSNLLIGFSRNTDVTIELKVNVALAFKKAKETIAQISTKQLTDEQSAMLDYEFKVRNRSSVSTMLGYSQGWMRKEALQIGFDIEGKTGHRVNPQFLLEDPEVGTPEALGVSEGTHAALVSAGSDGSSPSNIGAYYGVSSTVVNDLLVKLGYQEKHASKKYLRLPKAKFLANLGKIATSKHGDAGKQFVSGWLYNTNKAFRDELTAAISAWKASNDAKRKLKVRS